MFFVLLVVFLITDTCDSHVFCQDSHVTGWTALGASCPVNCPSVIEAVKKLKQLDLEYNFSQHQTQYLANDTSSSDHDDSHQSSDLNSAETRRRDSELKEFKLPSSAHFRELYKILHNKKSGNELQALFKIASAHLTNDTCWFLNKLREGKHKRFLNKNCVRKLAIDDGFVKKLTAILNKYSTAKLFSDDVTVVFLEKVLGKSMDLPLGLFDVQKTLQDLRRAISKPEWITRASDKSITLKSRFCLNVYLPGCFCISGYVESNGQCVLPRDCFKEHSSDRKYASRVLVQ